MRPYLYIIAFLLFISCSASDETAKLKATDNLLRTRPDSALRLLDQMQHVGQMNEKGVMHYVWNHAMAHHLLGMSLEEDSLVPNAVAYYRRLKDVTRQLDGYLLKASYLRWTGHEREALHELEAGIEKAKQMGAVDKLMELSGMQIDLLQRSNNYAAAAEKARTILNGKYRIDNSTRGSLLFVLGLNLSLLDDRQADLYYNESIKLALADGRKEVAAERIRNYADALSEKGEYARSIQYISRFQQLMPQYADISVIQLSLANNYANLHQLDSADYHLAKAISSERALEKARMGNLNRRASIEQLRNVLNYAHGKAISSIAFNRYCDSVTMAMMDKENTSLRRLEMRNRLQAANYDLHRSRLYLLLGIVLLLVLIGGGGSIAYWLYRRKYQRLAEAEERIDTLTGMLERMQAEKAGNEVHKPQDADFFRKVLLQQLGIIKLVAATPTNQNQALLKRIAAISGGEIPTNDLLDWSALYPIIDRLYHNFHTRLTEHFGDRLTEKEIQICCLLCAGFSTKEIGVVTQQTSATIYVRKTSIRKKIGAAEGEDIVAHVNAL
ncbi:MAG: LuxR family transcriptional regulator [Prevotella sp.]|nr:LuxR family transcriptional regulator [Prevotella sp.]MDY4038561.1 LuxR family transcriptional regulator [Prevotella sp.]